MSVSLYIIQLVEAPLRRFMLMAAEFSSKNDLGNKQEKKVKYPFNGVAFNLIDKFLVLGYAQKYIDYAFKYLKREIDVNRKVRYEFFKFQERPAIINEICNDYSEELINNDSIYGLIFLCCLKVLLHAKIHLAQMLLCINQ